MNFYTILLVAGALGTDAFSLAVCMGLGRGRSGEVYLFPLIVAIFHVLMPLAGLWVGTMLGKVLGQLAAVIGGIVLVLLGLNMLKEAREKKSCPAEVKAPLPGRVAPRSGARILTGFWALVIVAGSVSLDALTAGLGLGAMKANLALTVLTFGLVAGLMTLIGLLFGQRLGFWLGEKAQFLGGLVLIMIGITMLLP